MRLRAMALMRTSLALCAGAVLLVGCAAEADPPAPTTSVTKPAPKPTPEPTTEPPAPDPYEGWTTTEFARGFASIKTPPGIEVSVEERDEFGSPPRYMGGYVMAFPNTQHIVNVSVRTAESGPAQSGVPCGDTLIADFDGARGVPGNNRLWLTTVVEDNYRYVNMILATEAPLGFGCTNVAELPAPAGGVVRAVMNGHMDASVPESAIREWADSDEARDVIKTMQSIVLK